MDNQNEVDKHKIKLPDGNDPENPVRIYTDGVFDCFHFGHARLLEQIKKMFKHVYLIVGVTSDEDTNREKGKLLMNENERVECVKHCKWTDEVVPSCPWICDWDFFDKLKIHYIAHDPIPYKCGDIDDVYGKFKEAGRFLPTKRTDGISTTDLIVRVIKDYDEYTLRSISRGSTLNELNIGKTAFFIADMLKKDNSEYSNNVLNNLRKYLQD